VGRYEAQHVAFGEDAGRHAGGVEDQGASHALRTHRGDRFGDRRVTGDREYVAPLLHEDVADEHGEHLRLSVR
jgi:hypothetical protein